MARDMDLTLARLKELLHYDPETGVFTWKASLSNRALVGATAGTIAVSGHRVISISGERFLAHRLAWFYVYGRWPSRGLDHANRNPDANWIDNLREATQSQNLANSPAHFDSSHGFKGVSRKRERWQARICCNYQKISLGCFDTPEEAHAVYVAAAKKVFGEFARAA